MPIVQRTLHIQREFLAALGMTGNPAGGRKGLAHKRAIWKKGVLEFIHVKMTHHLQSEASGLPATKAKLALVNRVYNFTHLIRFERQAAPGGFPFSWGRLPLSGPGGFCLMNFNPKGESTDRMEPVQLRLSAPSSVRQDLTQEQLGPLVLWIVEKRLGVGLLDDFSFIHKHDAVGHPVRKSHFMRHHNHRHAFLR